MSLPHANIRSVWGVLLRPGARPKRVSLRELISVERSKKKTDALLMSWSAWMADRKTRPMRKLTRYVYLRKVVRSMAFAEEAGRTLIAGDVRTVRYVLGRISPHPSTQAGYVNALRSFYDFLKEQGIRKDNPAREVGRPPQFRGAPRPLSFDEACSYMDAAWELGPKFRMLASLGLYMGFRREEIRARQWTDFFAADDRMWCDLEGKGGRIRRQYVHPEVARCLPLLREEHRDPRWLFPSPVRARAGEPVSPSTLQAWHDIICDSAGLEGFTLHQLRHTYATMMRAKGGDLAVVQKGLGHTTPMPTMVYMEVFNEEVATIADRLDFRRKEKQEEGSDGEDAGSSSEAG